VRPSSLALSTRHRIAALRSKVVDELANKLRSELCRGLGGVSREATKTPSGPLARKQERKVCETRLFLFLELHFTAKN